jgi:hypothetical protein
LRGFHTVADPTRNRVATVDFVEKDNCAATAMKSQATA